MSKSNEIADPTKRGFIQGILAIGAVGGLAQNLPTAAKIASEFLGDVSATLGPHRLLTECRDIRGRFLAAKTGELMAIYQGFWPLVLDDPEFLHQLERACTEASNANDDHRRRALPAVASIHSSASLHANLRHHAADLIYSTHDDALNHNPHREVLEILWQNVTAATIRNELNWTSIAFEQRFFSQGEEVCLRFLAGERAIFMAAIHAFHAMLAYRLSLRDRRGEDQGVWLDRVIANILERERIGGTGWFERLRQIFDSRTDFEVLLPNLTEVVIGHLNFDPDIVDYMVAVRLNHYGLTRRIAAGEISSQFMTSTRAKLPRTLPLITDYGISPQIWSRARSKSQGLMSDQAVRDADSLFANYDALLRSSPVQSQSEANTATLLASRVPFRNQPERSIVTTSMNEGAVETVAKSQGFAGGLPGLLLTAEFLQTGRKDFDRATHLRVDKAHGIIEKEFPDLIKKPLSFFDEWLRELPASRTNRSTPVGAASSRSPSGAAARSPFFGDTQVNDKGPTAAAGSDFVSFDEAMRQINEDRIAAGLAPLNASGVTTEEYDEKVRSTLELMNQQDRDAGIEPHVDQI